MKFNSEISSYSVNAEITQRYVLLVIVGFILVMLCTIRPVRSIDTHNYYQYYKQIWSGVGETAVEISYKILSTIFFQNFGDVLGFRVLLFFYAALAMTIVLFAISDSPKVLLSFVIWFSFAYSLQMLMQIRSAVANALFLFSIRDIYKGNWKNYYLKCIVAFIFHQQALVLFIIYPIGRLVLQKRRLLLFITPFFVILAYVLPNFIDLLIYLIGRISPLIAYKLEYYSTHSAYRDQFTNPVNRISIFIIVIIFFELFVVGLKRIQDDEIIYIFILSISIFCYFIGYFAFPLVAMRYPECFNLSLVFLLPCIGERYFKRQRSTYYVLVWIYLCLINIQYSTFSNIISVIMA